ncbi:MAG: hypothetical protein PQJ61_06860 [Spirochaetales bacterium]|uniref:Uncharacterized protein n=1 Tax=Candidatus Thalassospirochaeta sargassi TaxID=3119039 RepID=A0AAJ1IEJ1_9SPIO|nr:hypothetical protein [Spirochaetales bacterium]
MNRIILFSDSRIPLKYFTAIENSSKWHIELRAHKDLRKTLKKPEPDILYLLDYESIPDEEKSKDLSYFLKKNNVSRTLIDRKNTVDDPAAIMMKGCDYLASSILKAGIKPQRLNKYAGFFNLISRPAGPADTACAETEADTPEFIKMENGWKGIKSGKDYSFYMLFTEISLPSDWKKKSGNVHLNKLKQTFQEVVDKTTAEYDGRLWIWNEYGGLVLFPYNGVNTDSVIPGIKLMLNRVIISIEDFELHTPIRLKAAMHLGTTTWKTRGKTGTIISDSLNSIFHLGTKYTPVNDMDITEEVYRELPAGVQRMFSETGTFEDRRIYRLCHIEVVS